MNIVNLRDVPVDAHRSPQGKFAATRRHLSLAAGGAKDTGPSAGGHPFDIELTRVPPGQAAWPLHAHAAQWEAFIIVSGQGRLRTETQSRDIGAGDFIVCPPDEAHQLINTGDADLVYYVIADNPPADIVRYPDSGKWFAKPLRKIFRDQALDYYDGEE